jgi:hypothetical protein
LISIVDHLYVAGWISTRVDFEVAFRLLAGEYGKDGEEFIGIINDIYKYIHRIALYLATILIVAHLSGVTLRNIVWSWKWDVRWPSLFRYKNRWLYLLSKRNELRMRAPYLTYVDALAEEGGKTQLYRGVIIGFTTDDKGELKDLYLTKSLRGKHIEEEGKRKFVWREIPGDSFILKYSEIKNLNVSFVELSPGDLSPLRQQGRQVEDVEAATEAPPLASPRSPSI